MFSAVWLRADGTPVRVLRPRRWGVLLLIVTCEECSTSFELDEARIPATGARVRCSRCKHAFFLPNPSASQSEAVDSIVEETTSDSLPNVPTAAADVSGSAVGDSVDSGSDVDEEDWQFSEEVRIEGDDDLNRDDDFGSTVDFDASLDSDSESSDFAPDDSEGLELADSSSGIETIDEAPSQTPEDETGLDIESDLESTASPRDESDFGSVDDFSSLTEEDESTRVVLAAEVESEMEIDESARLGASDELDDPENWDLVGNDDFDGIASREASPPSVAIGASVGDGPESVEASGAAAYTEEADPISPLLERLASVGRGMGWTATIGMISAILYLGLLGDWSRGPRVTQVVSAGSLTAEAMNLSWVETNRAGNILIIEGQIRNVGPRPLWAGTLQVVFLDSEGERLNDVPIRAGVPLPKVILREAPADRLLATALEAERRLRATPLRPSETRAFEAIALGSRISQSARRVLIEMGDPGVGARNVNP